MRPNCPELASLDQSDPEDLKLWLFSVLSVFIAPRGGGGGWGNTENIWAGVCRWNFEDTPYSYKF